MIMIKNSIIVVSAFFILSACTNNAGHQAEERKVNYAEMLDKPTTIEFDEMAYDFGSVKDGDPVKHTFNFKNTGKETLIFIDVKGSCGCTVPEWPKEPILPGESGQIDVTFDSKNRVGMVRKTVRIQANTEPAKTTLEITGEVTERI